MMCVYDVGWDVLCDITCDGVGVEVIIHTLYRTKRVLFLLKKVVYQKSTLFERSSNIKRVLFLVKKVFIGRVLFFPEVW